MYQLQGKITVQVDADATRDHFGGAQRLVSSKLTPWRQCIETPKLPVSSLARGCQPLNLVSRKRASRKNPAKD